MSQLLLTALLLLLPLLFPRAVVVVARCLRALRRWLFPRPPIDLMVHGWDVEDDGNWGQWQDPAGQ